MTESVSLAFSGLYTNPNSFTLPPGAYSIADNVVCVRENLVQSRRGQKKYGKQFTSGPNTITEYKGSNIVHYGADKLAYDSDDTGNWVDYTGSFTPISGLKMHFSTANKNLYFNTTTGLYRLDTKTSTPVQAGVTRAFGGVSALVGTTGYFATAKSVVYSVVWSFTDANQTLYYGTPSERIKVSNTSGGSRNVQLTIQIPAEITIGHKYKIYRSPQINGEPNNELQLAVTGPLTPQNLVDRFFIVTDSTDDTLLGETIYTASSQQGLVNGNERPPLAVDMTIYKDQMFYGNTTDKQRLKVALTKIGGSDGLVNGDTITIANVVYTASTTSEVFATGTFFLQAGGISPAGNIEETARSIGRVINGNPANKIVYAYYISGFQDVPGNMEIVAREFGISPFAFTSTKLSAWNPAIFMSGQTLEASIPTKPGDVVEIISNNPTNITAQSVFTATQDQTTFTFTYAVGFVQVFQNGQKLINTIDFTATTGTSIVLITPAFKDDTLSMTAYTSATILSDVVYTATLGQTIFALTYTVGYAQVWQNGTKLVLGIDFTAINGTSIVLITPAVKDDTVECISIIPSSITSDKVFTPEPNTNNFNVIFTPGFVDLYLNGDKLVSGVDFQLTSTPAAPTTPLSLTSVGEVNLNYVFFSKIKEPESVPLGNFIAIGSKDKPIRRIIALRDSLIIFKDDGLFRIIGEDKSNFRVINAVSTAKLIAPETMAIIQNQVYCLTNQGVFQINETNPQIISRQIENKLLPIIPFSNLATTSFGVGYESDRHYILFVPNSSTDTSAKTAYVYNTITNVWTTWSLPRNAGVINTRDEMMYLLNNIDNYVYTERKTYTNGDYADDQFDIIITSSVGTSVVVLNPVGIAVGDTIKQGMKQSQVEQISGNVLVVADVIAWSVGNTTVFKPIPIHLRTAKVFGQNPAVIKHFDDLVFVFDNESSFKYLDITYHSSWFNTNISERLIMETTGKWGEFPWGNTAWGGGVGANEPKRTVFPVDVRRSYWIDIEMKHSQAFRSFGLAGLELMYENVSSKTL